MVNRWTKDEQVFDSVKISNNYINAEKFDLAKFGWTESKTDDEIFSYIRGYVWRNFRVRIEQPIDEVLFWLIELALESEQENNKVRKGKLWLKKPKRKKKKG